MFAELFGSLIKAEKPGHKYKERHATGDPTHPWAYVYDTEEHRPPEGKTTFAAQAGTKADKGDLFGGGTGRKLAKMGPSGARKLAGEITSAVGMAAAKIKPGGERVSGFEVRPKGEQWVEVSVRDYAGMHRKAGVGRDAFEGAALRKLKTLLAKRGYTFDESRYGRDASVVLVGRFADQGK